jgi:hypothetical protein
MRFIRKAVLIPAWVLSVAIAMTVSTTPSWACMVFVSPKLEDVNYADVVVLGRISNYRIVRDEAFRKHMLTSRHLTADMRRMYSDPKQGLMTDYARFDIQVEKVLKGQAGTNVSVTWDNSTFGEPGKMKTGRYLVALRRSNSASPPLRGPSATIAPNPNPTLLTVLQAPCSSPFLYEIGTAEAQSVIAIVQSRKGGRK